METSEDIPTTILQRLVRGFLALVSVRVWLCYAWRWVCLFGLMLAGGCSQDNTVFAPGFSIERFNQISKGMTESEVASLLGKPFNESTHVDFKKQGSNNYQGRLQKEVPPGGTIRHYTLTYSKPADIYGDYVAYNIFLDVNGYVIGKEHYEPVD